MRICIIANKFPSTHDPSMLVFVQQLAWELADQGAAMTVVSPIAINLNLGYWNVPAKYVETTNNGSRVHVFRPKYFGFGQSHTIFGKSPVGLTVKTMEKAVWIIRSLYRSIRQPHYICR